MHKKIEDVKIFSKLEPLLLNTLESNIKLNNFDKLCKVETEIADLSFYRRLKFLLRAYDGLTPLIKKKADKKLKKRLMNKIHIIKYSLKNLNHIFFHHEKIHVIDKLVFDYADGLISKKNFDKYFKIVKSFKKRRFPLTGEDLKNIGYKSGKKMGITLDKITNWWIMNDFKKNKKSCIEYAKELL